MSTCRKRAGAVGTGRSASVRRLGQSGQWPCRSKYSRARSSASRSRSPLAPALKSQLMKKIARPALTIPPPPSRSAFAAQGHHDQAGDHDGGGQHVAQGHHQRGVRGVVVRLVAGSPRMRLLPAHGELVRIVRGICAHQTILGRALADQRLQGPCRGGRLDAGASGGAPGPGAGAGHAQGEHGAAAAGDQPPGGVAGRRQSRRRRRRPRRCRGSSRSGRPQASGRPGGWSRPPPRRRRPGCRASPRRPCR